MAVAGKLTEAAKYADRALAIDPQQRDRFGIADPMQFLATLRVDRAGTLKRICCTGELKIRLMRSSH